MYFLETFLPVSPIFLLGFFTFVVIAIFADFILLNKPNEKVSIKQATIWSIAWIIIGLVFNIGIWFWYYKYGNIEQANIKGLEFFTAYVVEKSLSIDNLFVFLTIFSMLGISEHLQKKVILIGVTGAIVLRTLMVFIGIWLIQQFSWILYVFGILLFFTGFKIILESYKEKFQNKNHVNEKEESKLLLFFLKFIPYKKTDTSNLLLKENGKTYLTTLGVAAILIMLVDIIFAVDSIPAVIAISTDPYIVLMSNILAVLGLRALYFILAELKNKFSALGLGLGIVLVFIGIKMLISGYIHLNPFVSLGVIISIITGSIVYSMVREGR